MALGRYVENRENGEDVQSLAHLHALIPAWPPHSDALCMRKRKDEEKDVAQKREEKMGSGNVSLPPDSQGGDARKDDAEGRASKDGDDHKDGGDRDKNDEGNGKRARAMLADDIVVSLLLGLLNLKDLLPLARLHMTWAMRLAPCSLMASSWSLQELCDERGVCRYWLLRRGDAFWGNCLTAIFQTEDRTRWMEVWNMGMASDVGWERQRWMFSPFTGACPSDDFLRLDHTLVRFWRAAIPRKTLYP